MWMGFEPGSVCVWSVTQGHRNPAWSGTVWPIRQLGPQAMSSPSGGPDQDGALTMYPTVAPPPRKRRAWPIVLAILAGVGVLLCGGLVVLIAATAGNHIPDAMTSNPPAPGQVGPEAARLMQPVRDGKFEFTVTKVQCGVPQVGDKILNRKAQGQYCLVSIKVSNIGDEPRTLAAANQHAFNAAGARYDADSTASIYLDDAGRALYEDINPGNTVNGTLIFDIPTGATLTRLELHDSALSHGVAVTLT